MHLSKVFPNQKEIDALEYYIKNFVWDGLQRTNKETPYSYGVYGTPSWYVNRDTSARRRNINNRNQDRMHVWRSYDYPHIIMLYYHMYQVAKMYPGMTHYLDAKGYLERTKETAKAYFKYPYEILPYPFRSEYAIDATAFESSHALAKYAVLNTMKPDSNLWYDKNLKKWYSRIRK